MKLWLDDLRDPEMWDHEGWEWAKTAEDAIRFLRTGEIDQASLDHDLTYIQMSKGGFYGEVYEDGQQSGYDVICWLEEHPQFWPKGGVKCHSANPAGRQRIEQVINKIEAQNEQTRD